MKGLQILLIGLALSCGTVRALPEVFSKHAFKLKRVERSLMDEMNSITAAINRSTALNAPDYDSLLKIRTIDDRNLLVKDDDGLAPIDRSLFEVNELKTYLTGLGLKNIEYEVTGNQIKGKTEKAGAPGKRKESIILFEAFIQDDPAIPNKQAMVIQSWSVMKGSKNAELDKNSARHFMCKHGLSSTSFQDNALTTAAQKCIQEIYEDAVNQSDKLRSFEEVVKQIEDLVKTEPKLTLVDEFTGNNSKLYRVKKQGDGDKSIEVFQLNVYMNDPQSDFVNVDCTQIDHTLSFRVYRKPESKINDQIKEEISSKLLSGQIENKLTIAKIAKDFTSIVNPAKCSQTTKEASYVSDIKKQIGQEQGFYSLRITPEIAKEKAKTADDFCLPVETTIGVMRYVSGFMQIAHFRFENKFFDYEFQVPCEEKEFLTNLKKEYDSIVSVANKLNKKIGEKSEDIVVKLEEIIEKLKEKFDVNFDEVKNNKQKKLNIEKVSVKKGNRVRFVLKDNLYTISIWHTSPGQVSGAPSTQISFQMVNSYDQVEHVIEQIDAFANSFDIKP